MNAPANQKSVRKRSKLRLIRAASAGICAIAAIVCCTSVGAAPPPVLVNPLFSFAAEGYEQEAPVVLASDGNFYGTTLRGGRADSGTIFRLTPGGVRTLLYTFDGKQGAPTGGLVQASDGNLYGVTEGKCCNGQFAGTVFRISLAGEFTTITDFSGTAAHLPRG